MALLPPIVGQILAAAPPDHPLSLAKTYEGKRVADIPPADVAKMRAFMESEVRAGYIGHVIPTVDPWPEKPGVPATYLLRRSADESRADLANWLGYWNNPQAVERRRTIEGQPDYGILGTGITAGDLLPLAAVVNPGLLASIVAPQASAAVATGVVTGNLGQVVAGVGGIAGQVLGGSGPAKGPGGAPQAAGAVIAAQPQPGPASSAAPHARGFWAWVFSLFGLSR